MQQATTRAASHRPGGQTPRRRAHLPINGRVTREDLEGLYAEFMSETRRALRAGELDEPPTLAEYHRYLVGALVDPPPRRPMSAEARRRIAAGQRRRRAQERALGAGVQQLSARNNAAA